MLLHFLVLSDLSEQPVVVDQVVGLVACTLLDDLGQVLDLGVVARSQLLGHPGYPCYAFVRLTPLLSSRRLLLHLKHIV